jgi:hypothetical protein
MTVGRFYRTIFMGNTCVVTSRLHSIVVAQFVIQAGQGFVSTQVSIRCAQAISAVLFWYATTSCERILQSFG